MDRRSKHVLALLIGLIIGGGTGLGTDTIFALKASREAHEATRQVQRSRIRSATIKCHEENTRHDEAKAGLEALVPRKTNRRELDAFVQALDPQRNCATYVPMLLGRR